MMNTENSSLQDVDKEMMKERILIIEPDEHIGTLLQKNLENEFHLHVDLCTSSDQALHLLNQKSYALISTEQYLPGQIGPQKGSRLVKELRLGQNKNRNIPILFFTTYAGEVFADHTLNKEDVFVLDKTSRVEKYLTWVKILLQSHKRRKEHEESVPVMAQDERSKQAKRPSKILSLSR